MGNDDNTPLTGVTGGGLPAEIWAAVMRRLTDGEAPGPLDMAMGPAADEPGADPAAIAGDAAGMIERVYREVLEGLGAPSGSGGSASRLPAPGADR